MNCAPRSDASQSLLRASGHARAQERIQRPATHSVSPFPLNYGKKDRGTVESQTWRRRSWVRIAPRPLDGAEQARLPAPRSSSIRKEVVTAAKEE